MKGVPGNVHLVLLAGGKGLRAGGEGLPPKQFRPTGKGLLFTVSLASFLELPAKSGRVVSITVTVADRWRPTVLEALGKLPGVSDLPVRTAVPGNTRTSSTWNALRRLEQLDPAPADLVAVHDAARPFADAALLGRLVAAAATGGGAVPGVPVADTVVQVDDEGRAGYLDRSRLLAVQTPQVFRWDLLQAAHAWAAARDATFTDDGGLLAECGHDPVLVPGEPDNWKVTTDRDWKRAEALLAEESAGQ